VFSLLAAADARLRLAVSEANCVGGGGWLQRCSLTLYYDCSNFVREFGC